MSKKSTCHSPVSSADGGGASSSFAARSVERARRGGVALIDLHWLWAFRVGVTERTLYVAIHPTFVTQNKPIVRSERKKKSETKRKWGSKGATG
jgi:hypothetical protein